MDSGSGKWRTTQVFEGGANKLVLLSQLQRSCLPLKGRDVTLLDCSRVAPVSSVFGSEGRSQIRASICGTFLGVSCVYGVMSDWVQII